MKFRGWFNRSEAESDLACQNSEEVVQTPKNGYDEVVVIPEVVDVWNKAIFDGPMYYRLLNVDWNNIDATKLTDLYKELINNTIGSTNVDNVKISFIKFLTAAFIQQYNEHVSYDSSSFIGTIIQAIYNICLIMIKISIYFSIFLLE